jgi:replicative DNA helicase
MSWKPDDPAGRLINQWADEAEKIAEKMGILLPGDPGWEAVFEEGLLRAVLYNDPGYERILEELEPEDFYLPKHQRIFRAAQDLFREKGVVDLNLLVSKNIPGLDTLDLLSIRRDPAFTYNIPQYIERVKELSRNRRAKEVLLEAHRRLEEGEDPESAFLAAQAALDDLGKDPRFFSGLRSGAVYLIEFVAELETRKCETEKYGRPHQGLETGFSYFDEVLGGLKAGLYVIAGPPSVGKTTFLKQIADQVAERNRVPVLFVSLEQSAEELWTKTLARLAAVNSRHIVRGDYPAPTMWEKVREAASRALKTAELFYILEGDKDTTVERIGGYALRILRDHGTEKCLVCVDYMQKLPVREKYGSAKDKLDYLASELRRLARRLNSPVLAASSEARAAYNKARMDAFKESGEIEYSADVAGVMESDRDEQQGGRTIRPVTLHIVKNRNGERARIYLDFCLETSSFEERRKEIITSPMYEDEEEEED